MYRWTSRVEDDAVPPSTPRTRKSSPVESVHGAVLILASFFWKRCARPMKSPFRLSRKHSSIASAPRAAVVIPCPYTGLNEHAASPATRRLRGMIESFS